MLHGNPLECLLAARTAFKGDSEAEYLVELTDARLSHGEINWLEVGAGNGENLRFLLNRLATSRRFQATALEPTFVDQPEGSIEWLRLKAEAYCPDRRFHWINVRHSAYYITDVVSEISRLAGYLSEDGMMAITHWSRDCILRRVHVAICGDEGGQSTESIEDLSDRLAKSGGLAVSQVIITETALDINKASEDASVAAALSRLACRGRARLREDLDAAHEIAALLRRLPGSDRRRNGIVFVRAATQ